MFKYIVGLDMSLQSPGICILNRELNFWNLYAFAQRKKTEIGFNKKIAHNAHLTLFPCIPEATIHSDAFRYKFIVDHISKIIPNDKNMFVMMEAYAFVNNCAGSNYKLHELGGVLKVELLKKNITEIHQIVNSSWKKISVGKGNCSKNETVESVKISEPFIDLMKILKAF